MSDPRAWYDRLAEKAQQGTKLEQQLNDANSVILEVYHDLCCGDPPDAMKSLEQYAKQYGLTLNE